MKQFTLRVLSFILLISCLAFGGAKKGWQVVIKSLPLDNVPGVVLKNRTNSHYLADRVIVKLMPRTMLSLSKGAFGIWSIDRVLSRVSVTSTKQMFPSESSIHKAGQVDLSLIYVLTFSSPNDPFTVAEQLSKLGEVQYAEPWFIYPIAQTSFPPNDSLYGDQWGLQKINAPSAWDYSQGDSTVVIAIVDTGVDWSHPDLAGNIWINPGETGRDANGNDKSSNGIDDDEDGKIDDWHGWDFVGAKWESPQEDNNPAPTADNNNHGTHVAGIAAAVTNNNLGVASIAFRCKILPIKCSADNDTRTGGEAYIIAGYEGIAYAARMGAKIINCSWGGEGGSQLEQDIIDYATQHGTLVVAAAGNGGSDAFFSPAGYRGVLGVAATDPSDGKSFYSNYGDFVDVCAPGDAILSTFFRVDPVTHQIVEDYEFLSGTSMASPLAAGVAALVRTQRPELSPLQVGEQVRVTCDDISATNPTYVGQLGHGRLNALRALTVENLPSVRLQSFAVADSTGGNGNGTPQPGETLDVTCVVRNFLARTSSAATLQLVTLSPHLTVTQGSFPLPQLGTLDSASNVSTPFRVYVHPDVPPSQTAKLELLFTDGSFSDIQTISIPVNPTYATHDINAIELTLTNNGRIGFYDFPDNNEGIGFVFNGVNDLYEGGLILGSSSTRIVDVVRNEIGLQDNDFTSNNFYTLTTPGLASQQDGRTTFTDDSAVADDRIGLQVEMYSYAFSDPVNSRYLILRYDIKNPGTSQVANLFAGIFLDWDLGDYNNDVSRYDPARSLGYCFDSSKTQRAYVGIRALDSAASYRSLVNDGSVDPSRSGKWSWISGGFSQASAGPADIHHVISSGPYTIAPGDSQIVGFALVAGDSSLADIQQNADAAKAKWVALRNAKFIPTPPPAPTPLTFALEQNYPNPFNLTTNVEFQLAEEKFVSLKVFDLLGREAATLVAEERKPGRYKITWDASRLPSGVYFYRLQAGAFVETKKMVLLK